MATFGRGPFTNADVNAERTRRAGAGVSLTLAGRAAIPVQTREIDRANLLELQAEAAAMVAALDVSTIPFRDANNTAHDLTAAEVVLLAGAALAYIVALIRAGHTLKSGAIPVDYTSDIHWPSANQ